MTRIYQVDGRGHDTDTFQGVIDKGVGDVCLFKEHRDQSKIAYECKSPLESTRMDVLGLESRM